MVYTLSTARAAGTSSVGQLDGRIRADYIASKIVPENVPESTRCCTVSVFLNIWGATCWLLSVKELPKDSTLWTTSPHRRDYTLITFRTMRTNRFFACGFLKGRHWRGAYIAPEGRCIYFAPTKQDHNRSVAAYSRYYLLWGFISWRNRNSTTSKTSVIEIMTMSSTSHRTRSTQPVPKSLT